MDDKGVFMAEQTLPIPVRRVLVKLGHDIREARLRRRISSQVMADRALIARATLHKLEKGDPSVAAGTYATVLFVLGLAERLAEVADARFDETGLALAEEHLPKRIRAKSNR